MKAFFVWPVWLLIILQPLPLECESVHVLSLWRWVATRGSWWEGAVKGKN